VDNLDNFDHLDRRGMSARARARLSRLWRAQAGRCFFCDGDTLFDGRLFDETRPPRTQRPRHHEFASCDPGLCAMQAALAMLARECDGGDRSRKNLVMACRFCVEVRQHAFAMDHRAEMRALIRYGVHPLHLACDVEAAA
jgi:hypothetical protein